jgi:hypothetical protein
MLNFTPVRNKQMTIADLAQKLTRDDLSNLTQEMIQTQRAMIQECTDADVIFVPVDPNANDTFATNADEVGLAWTLGHVIVHTTAASEESAALAAELARGVPHRGGRSRAEVPWRTVTTIAQCRHRLQESLRMRLASLDMWPDEPDLQNSYQIREGMPPTNAQTRFVNGLMHDDSHLGQIAEIVRQAKATKG